MIDVNDLNKLDCSKALNCLEDMDDYSRMDVGVAPVGPYNMLKEFILQIEALQRKYTKPIAALLKGPNG